MQDLEIAYEQMALAQDTSTSSDPTQDDRIVNGTPGSDSVMPIEDEEAAIISAAHPS